MIYTKNFNTLEKNHQQIFSVIKREDFSWDEERVSLLSAKNGDKIVVYNSETGQVYLNSRYNPVMEASKYMEEVKDMREKSILTIFGLSNGDFLRSALEYTTEEVYIIVYEPSVDIFMNVIREIDLSDILDESRVCLVVEGINEQLYEVVLNRVVQRYNKTTNRHIILPKYAEAFNKAFEEFHRKTNEAYDRLNMLNNTVVDFGEKVCENDFLNLAYLEGCRSGFDMVGLFPENIPAIVVSAGPSLAKNKHLLKEAKGKALIIAVDTALPHMMDMDVKPDMVITVDPNKPVSHFRDEGIRDIPLVIDVDSNNDILEYVKPENIIVGSANVLLWLEMFTQVGSTIDGLEIGGSVATAAIANLIHWGLRRIILIGQDLAYTGGITHVGKEKDEFDFSTGHYTYVKGIEGDDLVVRKDYLTYLRWIENIAYRFPVIDFIDATEGGALIQNTRVMSFREAIDEYCINDVDISQLIEEVPRLFVGDNKNVIIDALENTKLRLGNMKKQMSIGALEAHKGAKMLSRKDFNVKELKKINVSMQKVDELILSSNVKSVFERLIPEAEIEFETDLYETQDDDIKESIRMYEKCEKYYKAISEACPRIIELIDLSLEKIAHQ